MVVFRCSVEHLRVTCGKVKGRFWGIRLTLAANWCRIIKLHFCFQRKRRFSSPPASVWRNLRTVILGIGGLGVREATASDPDDSRDR